MIPAEMDFIDCPAPGGPAALIAARGPVPVPRAGEVLVRVAWAGVNRPDVAQRQGRYPPPRDASPIIGLEVAGEIAQLGDGVAGLHVGDAVCALTNGGGYAGFVAVPAPHHLGHRRCPRPDF